MKIWSVKSLSGEKRLNFLPPQQCYITNMFTPEKYRIIHNLWLIIEFHPDLFDIALVILLSPWHVAAPRRHHGNPR